ncbi:MAG: AMP phosphorylase [Candidatus Methanoplasma sp.]|nr:AMP phosphorylase [Candidatus Methanoplasma sp.]
MNIKVRFLDISNEPTALINPKDSVKIGGKDNDRVRIDGKRSTTALLNVSDFVNPGEAILSADMKDKLGASDGDELNVVYASSPESVRSIRKKMDNEKLSKEEISGIVQDIVDNRLSRIEISAWLTALHINGMDIEEIAAFTVAMVDTGDRVEFDRSPVYDFHSLGGVPGNKITPIVVSIVAAAGLMLPKTSTRAISSACGTSDFVETFCEVEMDADTLKRISEKVGGVLAWGGAMNLAPVDDLVIKVEHPLGINPRAQMLASILSKKLAIGATHLVVDIPTGSGTKVPTIEVAKAYARDFMDLGEKLNIHIECAITYADQPVGSAIGPKLEARECIRILEGDKHPASVVEKACDIAGMILEMGGIINGGDKARELLASGAAMTKFREIVEAQKGNYDLKSSDLVPGEFVAEITSVKSGYVHSISNKDLVSIAKAAGAPSDKGAGILLHKKKGQREEKGEALFDIYSDNKAKLDRAKELAATYKPYDIEGMLLKRIAAPRTR